MVRIEVILDQTQMRCSTLILTSTLSHALTSTLTTFGFLYFVTLFMAVTVFSGRRRFLVSMMRLVTIVVVVVTVFTRVRVVSVGSASFPTRGRQVFSVLRSVLLSILVVRLFVTNGGQRLRVQAVACNVHPVALGAHFAAFAQRFVP